MDINTVQVPAECTLINERKQERRRRRRASSYDFNSAVWKNRKKETPVAFIVAVHGNPLSRFREHPARARFFSPRDAAIITQERDGSNLMRNHHDIYVPRIERKIGRSSYRRYDTTLGKFQYEKLRESGHNMIDERKSGDKEVGLESLIKRTK